MSAQPKYDSGSTLAAASTEGQRCTAEDLFERLVAERLAESVSEFISDMQLSFSFELAEEGASTLDRSSRGIENDTCGPLTVSLHIDGLGSLPERYIDFDLREALADTLDDCAQNNGSWSYGLGRISEELRKLADEIDVARSRGEEDRR